MTKGVTLLAIGRDAYRIWAVNMALSIKHFAPDLLIQLVVSPEIKAALKYYKQDICFDYLTEIDNEHTHINGVFAPGKAKIALPSYFIFDKTLYLDTDGVVIKDLTPVFDLPYDLIMHVHNYYVLGEIESPESMYWCNSSVIMKHYNLAPETKLPAINSSAFVYTNTNENKALFQQAYDNISNNPIPREKLFKTWGRGLGLQPDELYLNIAIGQTKVYPESIYLMHFRPNNHKGKLPTFDEIKQHHYGVGLYGGEDTNHASVKNIYDAVMRPIWEAKFPDKHYLKAHQLLPHKIVNEKHN